MKIKSIEKVQGSLKPEIRGSENDKQKRNSTVKEYDDKLNIPVGFRNELGLSQSEYAKNKEASRKIGFASLLADEMTKFDNK